jgi:hypothetical protein
LVRARFQACRGLRIAAGEERDIVSLSHNVR